MLTARARTSTRVMPLNATGCTVAKYQQDIENVGTQDVAEGELAFLLECRHHARGKLRQGSAAREQCHRDELVADAEAVRHADGGIHEPLASEHEACEACESQQYGLESAHILRRFSIFRKALISLEAKI